MIDQSRPVEAQQVTLRVLNPSFFPFIWLEQSFGSLMQKYALLDKLVVVAVHMRMSCVLHQIQPLNPRTAKPLFQYSIDVPTVH